MTYNHNSLLEDVKMIDGFVVRLESKSPLESTATWDEVAPKYNGTVLTCTTYTSHCSEEFNQTTILVVQGILYMSV